ncbi:MAG: cell wall-binding repeat-containing protein [Mycobacteriales bacterium]
MALRTFGTSDTVLLANGREDHLPDALAGNYLAGFEDAPILLTDDGGVPATTQSALDALGATRVIILGGTDAVSAEQEAALEARYVVERVGGLDRYETARLIALEPGPGNVNAATAIIARGDAFPDALVSGPIAFRSQFPILLVRPDAAGAATTMTLSGLNIERVIIAGGTDAVSVAVADEVRRSLGDDGRVDRVAGPNRQETSVAIADLATGELGFPRLHVNLANGGRVVDALTGGPHAGREGSVILLTENSNVLGGAAEEYLATAPSTLKGGHVFGGTEALSDALVGAATDAAD